MPENTEAIEQQEAEAKTFTQDDVNRIVAERLKRAKSEVPTDYEELKAKAAEYDKAQEAAKSDLEKALESATRYKTELDELRAANERRDTIARLSDEYKVDARMLERMSGDVEDNAKFLAETAAAAPKYPTVTDSGEPKQKAQPRTLPKLI